MRGRRVRVSASIWPRQAACPAFFSKAWCLVPPPYTNAALRHKRTSVHAHVHVKIVREGGRWGRGRHGDNNEQGAGVGQIASIRQAMGKRNGTNQRINVAYNINADNNDISGSDVAAFVRLAVAVFVRLAVAVASGALPPPPARARPLIEGKGHQGETLLLDLDPSCKANPPNLKKAPKQMSQAFWDSPEAKPVLFGVESPQNGKTAKKQPCVTPPAVPCLS